MVDDMLGMVIEARDRNFKFWPWLFKLNKLLLNIILPISQMLKKTYGLDEKSDVIISLTSYPARIHTVWVTVGTLLCQSVKPKKVVLWLAEDQFPGRRTPKMLERLKKRGLEIWFCEDLKPHKKYFYAMQRWTNCKIVLVDDDIFYPESFLERLLEGSREWPETVLCNRSHVITFNEKGFEGYMHWKNVKTAKPNYRVLPVGCDGVLYPAGCFALSGGVFDVKIIKNLSLYTDDLWLKCMSVQAGLRAINVNKSGMRFFNNVFSQFSGLWKENTHENGRNDRVWSLLMEKYPEIADKIKSDILDAPY